MHATHTAKLRLTLAAALALAAAAAPARAQTTIFTSRSAFNAALGGYASDAYTETFAAGTAGTAASYSFTGTNFHYTATAQGSNPNNDPGQGLVYRDGDTIGTNFSADNLVLTFGPGVYAVGGNFYSEDAGGAVDPAQEITLALSDGTIDIFTTGADASDGATFRGYLSQTPITALTFDPTEPDTPRYATLDNFVVAAPEPSEGVALGLGILGLGGLIIRSRRRKNAA